MLDGLQVGRAAAAIMVVLFHANVFILPDKLLDGTRAGNVFNMGYAGVEFFFVLSGFIMFYVHRKDFGVEGRAARFMRKRLFRIYPIYWVVLSGLLALYFAMPGRGPEMARDPQAIIGSYLLLPMPHEPILNVAWTLQHEMLFYVIFALVVMNLRLGMLAFVIWMAGCVANLGAEPQGYVRAFIFSAYNILFLFGMAAALVFRRIEGRAALPVLLAGLALFFAVGLSEAVWHVSWNEDLRTILFGLGAALAVTALAAGALIPATGRARVSEHAPASAPGPRRTLTPPGGPGASPGRMAGPGRGAGLRRFSPLRAGVFLGDASFAIYLTHLPAMSFLAVILAKLGLPALLPPLAVLVLVCGLAIAVGCLVHVYVEKPLNRALRPLTQVATA
ncbi:acyltransferase family protein [Albibacillus kandeliae]|uniref:acyltransferase family protein n=1 Tax=Albibacillus kandeliae TaxID=2174228 RepID=UPI0013004818|nr:acyltransferase [Albibacillus kandeliae]